MIRNANLCLALLFIAVTAGCQTPGQRSVPDRTPAPLLDGMGTHQRAVTTSSPLAQRYFNQGLVLTYAFNHDEAIRSFREATRIDPNCAMAWWGVALCHGPHINDPVMTPERSRAAWQALQKAMALRNRVTPVERDLIEALAHRYADPAPADRGELDQAYAVAMRKVWETYPDDPDVGTLYAEALMDLRPWDLWTESGQPQPGTLEILTVLEDVFRLKSDHPGALHYYIHTIEASPHPERALAAADRLRPLVPGAGHLLHMPSHIDVLTGRWSEACDANIRAVQADRKYREISPQQGFYHVYMTHNHHMLAFAAMMQGRSELALKAARQMIAGVSEDFAREQSALVDPYMAIELEVLMRFGRWDDILAHPAPPEHLPITRALWRFMRGVAYAAKGQTKEARAEQVAFRHAARAVPEDALMAINPASLIMDIADHVLEGEIAYREKKIEKALVHLRRAVEREAELRYMEPPEWLQAVRHPLGAILLDVGRYEEAERVYREDLSQWPNNGWSLYGLAQALRARGELAEARDVEKQFEKSWSNADVRIGSSCFCVHGAGQ